ncbi:hypothetical protein [Porphyrobacter sp. AAP82]|uniref:hypothetical protein n=1 Tax=Porphyrobacter sp. AAP82 TaxID=1248917 RepID=UPI00030CFC74|nr:hypothetical protein [Porphyrobacter sp. AAP82]
MSKTNCALPLAALALLAVPAGARAQNYSDLPPLAPMGQNELRELPADMRAAPSAAPVTAIRPTETLTIENGVETVTRTRYINAPGAMPPPPPHQGYAPQGYGYGYAAAPAVFERGQWLDECRRRTRGQNRDNTGLIIGGLLGAIGGGLIGGLIGSLFDDDDDDRYDCDAALDAYLSHYGTPGASRQIGGYGDNYGYAYPQSYAYAYAQQMVMVPVRTEVQQQVVVRETIREETYTVPGSTRIITDPAPRPAPGPRPTKKMLRQR